MDRFKWERAVASKRGPVNPTTRHVLLTLATHANKQLQAWPTISTQAIETGLSERAVRTHLKIAVQEGWLARACVCDGKAWRNYRYTLTTPPTVAEGAARSSVANSVNGAEPGSAASDSIDISTEGAAPGTHSAERHSDGVAADDTVVRNDMPTNMECSSISKSLKEVNIEKADFVSSDLNPKTEGARKPISAAVTAHIEKLKRICRKPSPVDGNEILQKKPPGLD